MQAMVLEQLEEMKKKGAMPCAPSASAEWSPELVQYLPAWVRRFGLLTEGANTWLYCEPNPLAADVFPSQAIIKMPPGRYMIDALDVRGCSCVSRESAAGAPLIVDLRSPEPR